MKRRFKKRKRKSKQEREREDRSKACDQRIDALKKTSINLKTSNIVRKSSRKMCINNLPFLSFPSSRIFLPRLQRKISSWNIVYTYAIPADVNPNGLPSHAMAPIDTRHFHEQERESRAMYSASSLRNLNKLTRTLIEPDHKIARPLETTTKIYFPW